jgi:hypothetical protein
MVIGRGWRQVQYFRHGRTSVEYIIFILSTMLGKVVQKLDVRRTRTWMRRMSKALHGPRLLYGMSGGDRTFQRTGLTDGRTCPFVLYKPDGLV